MILRSAAVFGLCSALAALLSIRNGDAPQVESEGSGSADGVAVAAGEEDALQRLADAYGTCSTYRDSGVLSRTLTTGSGDEKEGAVSLTMRIGFKSVFSREKGFLFTYRRLSPLGPDGKELTPSFQPAFLVGRSDGQVNPVRAWDPAEGLRSGANLMPFMRTFGGVSQGLSLFVPGLLMRDVKGLGGFAPIPSGEDVVVSRDGPVDVDTGRNRSGHASTARIRRSDGALLECSYESPSLSERLERVKVTFAPDFGTEVSESELDFDAAVEREESKSK
jgi:hypothetical protein